MKKDPGLKIGIIGCGRIGYQLARSFLEFSEVYPNEMEISTRQPDSLGFFANQNIKCYFDNAQVARFAEILFLCVLPTQLGMVIDEIKNHLNQHCTVYSVIRTETEVNLKNLLYWTPKTIAIIKPTYAINDKTLKSKWDYMIDTIENMKSLELIESLNPFAEHQSRIHFSELHLSQVYLKLSDFSFRISFLCKRLVQMCVDLCLIECMLDLQTHQGAEFDRAH